MPDLVPCIFDNCTRTFKKKQHLEDHIRTHTGERPFVCTEPGCDKAFGRAEHLKRHEAVHVHSDLFPYVCTTCGSKFKVKWSLTKHAKRHEDNRSDLYKCTTEGCDASFSKKNKLYSHILHVHGISTPFTCPICNKSFSRQQSLNRHKAKHFSKFMCTTCFEVFDKFSALQRHNHQIHPQYFHCQHCGKSFRKYRFVLAHIKRVHKEEGEVGMRQEDHVANPDGDHDMEDGESPQVRHDKLNDDKQSEVDGKGNEGDFEDKGVGIEEEDTAEDDCSIFSETSSYVSRMSSTSGYGSTPHDLHGNVDASPVGVTEVDSQDESDYYGFSPDTYSTMISDVTELIDVRDQSPHSCDEFSSSETFHEHADENMDKTDTTGDTEVAGSSTDTTGNTEVAGSSTDITKSSKYSDGPISTDLAGPSYGYHGISPADTPKDALTVHTQPTTADALSCPECGRIYRKQAQLTYHRKRVHKVKPVNVFQCSFNDCKKSFMYSSRLVAHIRNVHEGIRQFCCSHCSSKFFYKHCLKNHIEAKHNSKKVKVRRAAWNKLSVLEEISGHIVDDRLKAYVESQRQRGLNHGKGKSKKQENEHH